jgi:hypothetical protein
MPTTHVRPWRRKEPDLKLPKVVLRARRKFLKFFPDGFQDQTYLDWERNYKWDAHEAWEERLADEMFRARLNQGDFPAVATDVVRIVSQTNLLSSSDKTALRDAIRSPEGAQQFTEGLYDWLYGAGEDDVRFERWAGTVGALPRREARVLTWPVLTVFGLVARPYAHMFLKPAVTRRAAFELGFDFKYQSQPSWETYDSLLDFAREVKLDTRDLHPRDMIDVQSFIRVQGAEEYD